MIPTLSILKAVMTGSVLFIPAKSVKSQLMLGEAVIYGAILVI
jgi:hypothetical protein